MSKRLLAVLAAFALPGSVFGATISLTDSVGAPGQVDIDVVSNPTGSFTINVDVAGVTDMTGLDFRLNSLDGTTLFVLTGRSIVSSVVTDPHATNAQVTSTGDAVGTAAGPDRALNPINDRNLGATSNDPSVGVSGSETVMTLTLGYANLVAGQQYRIQVTGNNDVGQLVPKWGDPEFNVFDFTLGPAYIVNATPEPMSMVMLLAGAMPLMLRRRRAA